MRPQSPSWSSPRCCGCSSTLACSSRQKWKQECQRQSHQPQLPLVLWEARLESCCHQSTCLDYRMNRNHHCTLRKSSRCAKNPSRTCRTHLQKMGARMRIFQVEVLVLLLAPPRRTRRLHLQRRGTCTDHDRYNHTYTSSLHFHHMSRTRTPSTLFCTHKSPLERLT